MEKLSGRAFTVFLLATLFSYSCKSLKSFRLMTWEDYVLKSRSEPYILELDSHGGKLVYYGAFHKVDPSHPQFDDIEKKWDELRPTFAFCEGNLWPLEESRTEAIENYGEQGLITYLAARDGIQVECIDPSLEQQVAFLKRYFPLHLVKAYYVMRQAAINRMMKYDASAAQYTRYYFRKLAQIYGHNKFPKNLDEFELLASRLFPSLDDWEKIPRSYFQCPQSGGFLTSIHRKLNKFRDRIMIKKVVQTLKKGHRIFAIVGRSHVVIQEAAIKYLSHSHDRSDFRNSIFK